MTPQQTLAHRYLARGLSIIPVPLPRPGVPPNTPGDGKTPIVKWKRYQTELATPVDVDAWFAEPMNIAVITGALSGVVVIDVDDAVALQWAVRVLPRTRWYTRTARGRHFWYRHPGGLVRGKVHAETPAGRLALDVRGDGNYVIAPGSVHASGHVYRADGDWRTPREELPIFSLKWIVHEPSTRQPSERRDYLNSHVDLLERARQYLAAIPRPDIGQGSDRAVLYAASRLVRGFSLPASDAELLLWDWCGNRPGWTRDWVAQKIQNAERYGTEPIGGLR